MGKKKTTLVAMSVIVLEDGTKLRPGDPVNEISDDEKEKYLKCEMIVDTAAPAAEPEAAQSTDSEPDPVAGGDAAPKE